MSSPPGWDPQLPRVGKGSAPTTEARSCVLDKYNDFIEANRIEDSRERMKTLRKLVREGSPLRREGRLGAVLTEASKRSLSPTIASVFPSVPRKGIGRWILAPYSGTMGVPLGYVEPGLENTPQPDPFSFLLSLDPGSPRTLL